ncbi:M48 family metalloprotease [Rubripirellula sp.]|nr:M48 family metalloprotease [Rubripirellula sp.]
MHLYFFLLVVLSLSCASLPPVETSLQQATLASGCMLTALVLLCHIAARNCARQITREQIDARLGADLLDRQMTAFRWLGLGIVILCLAGFGLATATVQTPYLSDTLFLQAVILLIPGLTITLATWSSEQYYRGLAGLIDNHPSLHAIYLWQRFRGTVAWLVLPILLLLGMTDLIKVLPMGEASAAIITTLALVLFVPLGLPWLIRHLFKTSRLDKPTEQWIDEIMIAAGLKRTRIVCWQTGNRSFNAMVAGFVPPLRTLLISDRALNELPRSELSMVILHEAAHLRRFHVPLRMLTIVPAWLLGGLITRFAEGHSWAMAAGSGVAIAMTLITLRIAAIRTELDADVQACQIAAEIADRVRDVPRSYEDASVALSNALLRITVESPSARKASWLHPGVSQRLANLQSHAVSQTSFSDDSSSAAANTALMHQA